MLATMARQVSHDLALRPTHGILVNKNDFCLRGMLACRRDSHLRERLLEYKCEVKSHIE